MFHWGFVYIYTLGCACSCLFHDDVQSNNELDNRKRKYSEIGDVCTVTAITDDELKIYRPVRFADEKDLERNFNTFKTFLETNSSDELLSNLLSECALDNDTAKKFQQNPHVLFQDTNLVLFEMLKNTKCIAHHPINRSSLPFMCQLRECVEYFRIQHLERFHKNYSSAFNKVNAGCWKNRIFNNNVLDFIEKTLLELQSQNNPLIALFIKKSKVFDPIKKFIEHHTTVLTKISQNLESDEKYTRITKNCERKRIQNVQNVSLPAMYRALLGLTDEEIAPFIDSKYRDQFVLNLYVRLRIVSEAFLLIKCIFQDRSMTQHDCHEENLIALIVYSLLDSRKFLEFSSRNC